ncbi:MAG: hypothetical protein HZB76_00825 [Chlamydiae bacterium]|nr:hypothetical protein [Chlamydiota bacterium]
MGNIIITRPQCREDGLWGNKTIYQKQVLEENLETIGQLNKICEANLKAKNKEFKCLALLSMSLPYKNLDNFNALMNGVNIPLFIKKKTRNYHLDETLDLGGGMKAYALIPEDNGPALIVFHGSFSYGYGSGAGQCVMDDLDPLGVGWSHFHYSIKDKVTKWQQKHKGRKIMAVGHSLGGAIANYCGVFIKEVEKVRAFCSPLLNIQTYDAYQQRDHLDIINYYHQNDPITELTGQRYIGECALVKIPESSQMKGLNLNPIKSHMRPLEAYTEVELERIEVENENNKLASYMPSFRTISRIISIPLWLVALTFFTVSRILIGNRGSHDGVLLTPIMRPMQAIQNKAQLAISDTSKEKIINFLNQRKKLAEINEESGKNYQSKAFSSQEFALAYLALHKNRAVIESRVPLKLDLFMDMAWLIDPKIWIDGKNLTAEKIAEYTFNPKQFLIDLKVDEALQDRIMHEWEQVEKTGFFHKEELWDEPSTAEKIIQEVQKRSKLI